MMNTSNTTISMPPSIGEAIKQYAFRAGILLLILGTLGLLLPNVMSVAISSFVAILLIIGGVLWGMIGLGRNMSNVLSWLKPIILIGTGIFMLIYPQVGIDILALWLAAYLLMDTAGSFVLAFKIRPMAGWLWMLFNGSLSLILAIMLMAGWPAVSEWFVGLYISISLLFDGISLLGIHYSLKKNLNA